MRFKFHIKSIFKSKQYILIFITALIAYFALYYYIILYSNEGVFISNPGILYTFILVDISSAFLLTLSIYGIRYTKRAAGSAAYTNIAVIAGSLIGSCSCNVPILATIFYFFGLSAVSLSEAVSFIAKYNLYIFISILIINLITILITLNSIDKRCSIRSSKLRSKSN
ncbi:MAG: hypothetical protein ARM1_0461 [Candidatus Micrarchaeota archaeon]|nr:MAG: hypothetical protein ARM1_0461 [Candidatus Micrarchaeota archaeon]